MADLKRRAWRRSQSSTTHEVTHVSTANLPPDIVDLLQMLAEKANAHALQIHALEQRIDDLAGINSALRAWALDPHVKVHA